MPFRGHRSLQPQLGLSDPENADDATNKSYVDTLAAAGLHWLAAVLDKDTLTPPGSPSEGDRYWIGGTGAGAWAGHDYEVAEWDGSAWVFTETAEGDSAYVDDEDVFYFLSGAGTLSKLATGMGTHAASHTNGVDDIQSATSEQKGLMTTTQVSKLNGIEESATADQTANEILTAIKTVDGPASGLDADTLDGNEATAFAVAAKGVTGGDSHDHNGGDGAQIDHVNLANIGTNTHGQIDSHIGAANPHSGSTPTTRTLSTTAPLTGGGDLSANRTLAISAATTGAAGSMSAADKLKLDGIEEAATADQTGAEIKIAYEAEADTNAFTDAEKSKLGNYPENFSLMGAYGVRWLKTATSPVLQKGIVVGGAFVLLDYQDYPIQQIMRRCVLEHNTADFLYYLHPNDSTKKADGTDANIDGTDGQVMVQVKEFEHLICDDGDYKYMLMGQFPFSLTIGANTYYSTLHPWFMEGGVHREYAYAAAFEGVLKQAVSAELMPNLVDRDLSGASAWENVDINAYDETGDLTLTASAADQYCTLPVASAPTTAGRKYTLSFTVANLVSTWIIKSYDGTQTIGTVDTAGAQSFTFAAATTGGLRIVAGDVDSSGDFDDFSLIRPAAYVDGTGAQARLTGDLIHSAYGYTPLTYFNRTERRQSRDGSFHEFSIAAEEAIILLYLTEYATWYSQDAATGIPGYTEGTPWAFAKVCKTGITVGLGNNSGSVTYAQDQAANALCSYDWSGSPTIVVANSFRGIENFYGHIWKWVDGVNINYIGAPLTDAEVYICNNPDQFADDTTTNYTQVEDQDGAAIDLPLTSGYQSALHKGLLWPSSIIGGGSDKYITDYFYASASAGWRALRSGGNLNSGVDAGCADRDAHSTASTRYESIGGRSAA